MMGNPNYCPKKLGPSPIINQFEGTEEEICAYNFAISQHEFYSIIQKDKKLFV